MKKFVVGLLLILSMAVTSSAQVYTILFGFDFDDGVGPPYMALVQGTDGNFYGTTQKGGVSAYAADVGTVFKITPTGTETVLYNFCSQPNCTDGVNPYAGLIQATDGNFYGTTFYGGAYESCPAGGCGTIFRITPEGVLTTLYSFCAQGYPPCTDGFQPTSALVQGIDGNLYGTTMNGGGNNGGGTVFRITLSGNLKTLYRFCLQPECPDGAAPSSALIQGTDGNFYGTTAADGANFNGGTFFKITAGGNLTTLYNFCSQSECTDGESPVGLAQGPDGNFYGTTYSGGTESGGIVFKMTPAGQRTTVYNFCTIKGKRGGCQDGAQPLAAPALGSDGYYFGMTQGSGDGASIYGVTPSGQYKTLYAWHPGGGTAQMVQGTDGLFYGTTISDTGYSLGTVFSLDVGLKPFIRTSPLGGSAGALIIILGTNLTGATSVTFNGTSANFTVVSASEITATVPSGATTGRVNVSTPSGTLTSNLPFYVIR
jgi:uncharacterized repeat protein (TIGR03803 family)